MRIDNPVAQEGNITGSFTGSFDGIGSGSFSGSYEGSVRSIDLVATGSFSGSLRSDDALLTGSYTGSFKGDGTEVLNVVSASYAVTSSHAVSALSSSHALNADDAISSSYAVSSSHALNADDAISSSYAVSSSYVTIGNISTNLADNRVLTSTATDKYNAESNLTFDGSVLTVTGDAIVTGDFTVTGTKTELQVSSLNVEDLNITVASGSTTSAASDGAGLTVAGAGATFTWNHTYNAWAVNKNLDLTGTNKITSDANDVLTFSPVSLVTNVGGLEIDPATAAMTFQSETVHYGNVTSGTIPLAGATKYSDSSITEGSSINLGKPTDLGVNTLTVGDGNLVLNATPVTATATELNQLDGNTVGGTTAGDIVTIDGSQTLSNKIIAASQVTEISNLTAAEGEQLENIGTTTISAAQWGYLGGLTATDTELNQLDGNTVGGTTAGDIVTIDGSQTLSNKIIAASQVTEISNLTAAEGAQLENIGTTTISATQWGYLGATTTFGGSLLDDADAATARTTLGLGTIATLNSIDISSNTNLGVTDTTGQTGINMSLTGDNISGVVSGLGTSADVQFDSFGVGTAASGTTGEIRATGDITAYYSSDERLKENFKTLDGALDKVNQLNGYEFDWKDGIEDVVSKKGHDIGVKAQEVQALYPELVHERDNGYLAVDYVKLTAVLLHAVKELSAKVDELSK